MEHILKPSDALPLHIHIPYLTPGELTYDGKGFEDFPNRRGFDVVELLHGNFAQHTWTESLTLFQQWLWFGVIVEVFKLARVELAREDFLSKDLDGNAILSTQLLPYYIGIWETTANLTPLDEHFQIAEQISAIICLSRRILGELVPKDLFSAPTPFLQKDPDKSSKYCDSVGQTVLLSITLLLDAVGCASKLFHGGDGHGNQYGPDIIFELLRTAGWCNNEIQVLDQRHSKTELIYLSMFNRHKLRKDHNRCKITDASMVLTWNKERCLANQLDISSYQTVHTYQGCSCPFISAKSAKGPSMDRILSREHYPLFKVETKSNGLDLLVIPSEAGNMSVVFDGLAEALVWLAPRLTSGSGTSPKLKSSSGHVRYVAISHVWSSGLGNPKENALPICQLKSIQNMVNELYEGEESILFWIDTLGVPLDPEWRRRGINHMHNVYRNADKVLVLDQSLQIASLDCRPEEAMQRIKISDWAQRLWTLPEGANAKQIFFQFDGRSISDNEIAYWYENVTNECGWTSQLKRGVPCDMCTDQNSCLGPSISCNTDYEDGMKLMAQCGASKSLADQWTSLHNFSTFYTEIPPLRAHSGTNIFESSFLAYKEMRDGLFEAVMEGPTIKGVVDATRWRTTSHVEDETLCLAQLLNIDPKPLLDAHPSERMRVLLSKFDSLPSNILFGNRDRYQEYGSRWMPMTLLNMGYENIATSQQMAKATDNGLLVNLPGARLTPSNTAQAHNKVLIYLETEEENPTRYYALLRDSRCQDWSNHTSQDKAIIFEKPVVQGLNVRAVSALLVSILAENDGVTWVRIEANLSFSIPPDDDRDKPLWGTLGEIVEQSWCCG